MKKLLFILLLPMSILVNATTTYYVSVSGSDSNPGTYLLPFKNWEKLKTVMDSGDIAYIRGGIYHTTKTASASVHCLFEDLVGTSSNPILIQNYPGESPVFDLWTVGIPTNADPTALMVNNCSYLHLKGLHIKNLQQNHGGSGISRGVEIWGSPHTTFELCEVDHIGGSGFMVQEDSDDAYFLNCDSHHNDDRWSTNSDPWGGADGFDVTGNVSSTRTIFEGCRAWLNSDDGWDNYNTDGIRNWKNCWSFWNGYYKDTGMSVMLPAGNGEGFKLGPTHSDKTTVTLRFLQNCVSFENRDNGFDQNGTPTTLYQLYNNTSYKNGGDGFQFQYYPSSPINHVFKNNIALANTLLPLRYSGSNTNNHHNTWSGIVSVSTADFESVSSVGVDGVRQADGSLPNLNFLKLKSNSDLVDAGINVGLPFKNTAPDMGAFELTATTTTPLFLINFVAIADNTKAQLKWQTTNEINFNHFDVERNSAAIGSVTGGLNNYSYTDNFPLPGLNYYRLKLIDNDGKYTYSNTETVDIKTSLIVKKATARELIINSSKRQSVQLSVFNLLGQLVIVSTLVLYKGDNSFKNYNPSNKTVNYLKLLTATENVVSKISY